MGHSLFSVEYEHPEHPDEYCAADWLGAENGGWIRSWKSKCGVRWHQEDDNGGKLDQLAYEAIIEKFGLETLKAELSIEKVQCMSPADLVKYREEKCLPCIEILSDTPGDRNARAEEYD